MNEITERLKADYGAVAYESEPQPLSHPSRLAVVAAMRGLAAAPVNDCKVLEIGCAIGGNLIPMAEQLPGSRFLGLDLSPRQIETGSRVIGELGLTNIELRCQDLMEFPDDGSTFDYIIAHGLYSWVPEVVRQKLLQICRQHLSANGLAYISYNTYPGWRSRGIIRDMMLFNSRGLTNPDQRAAKAREIVQFIAERTPEANYYRDLIRSMHGIFAEYSDSYLLHELIEAVNSPQHFWEFIDGAKSNGLAYLGDGDNLADERTMFSATVREMLSKMTGDEVEREQYVDFLINRSFRRSVLCWAEAAIAGPGSAASAIRSMCIAGNPAEAPAGTNANGQPVFQFGVGHHSIKLSDSQPIAVFRRLRQAWPAAVSFSELMSVVIGQSPRGADEGKLAELFVEAVDFWYAVGLVELWIQPSTTIASSAGEYPRTTRYIRWQATHHRSITTLRHVRIKMDELLRQILPLLDGKRNRDALASELVRQKEAGGAARTDNPWPTHDPQRLKQMIDTVLSGLTGASVLVGD
jgi:methyltransferase-like protein/2-polyprenyl-3-methyl-5-hydroxy-6-metoxy-1,4-benzoquinol methylase